MMQRYAAISCKQQVLLEPGFNATDCGFKQTSFTVIHG